MINEYIRYTIPAESADAFVAAYDVASESLRASPHCLAYELSRCSEAPDQFIVRISWDSTAGHLEGFRKSSEFRTFYAAVKAFFARIDEMRHYETRLAWSRE